MKLECEFFKPCKLEGENFVRHNMCISLDGLRGCVDFDREGNMIHMCKSLKLKEA